MIRQLISTVVLLIVTSAAVAQTAETEQTTGNLVYTSVNPAPTGTNIGSSWSGFSVVNSTGGNTTSDNGAVTGYNMNTGTFMFGYNQGTIAYTYSINQALANSGSGIVVQGYNYSWQINNLNYDNRQSGTDILTARIITFDPSGAVRRTDTWTYDTKFDWTTFSGIVNYANPGAPSEFGNMRIEFTGRDSGFWAGYYGPMVRDIDVRLRYGVDPCVTNPQSSPSCPGFKTFYTIPDDGHAIVPLPFGFPFYGQIFTHSIFFDNGAVSFYSPTQPQRWGGGGFGGYAINSSLPASHFYTIMPLNTDLIANGGLHYTQGDSNYLRYTWDGVSQFGRWDSRNTFSLEIQPTGYIGLQYNQIDIEGGWTSGIVGNASLGEFITFDVQVGSTFSVSETVPTDCSNPLNNVNCPGYAEALFQQQCSANVLYSPACPGYTEAYFVQQCSINTLYDTACPGYAVAYYNYQCSLDALYHTGCPGYAEAYFDQQCGLDPLYNNQCPGYAQAYALKFVIAAPSASSTSVVEETVAVVVAATAPETATVATESVAPAATVSAAEPAAPVQLVSAPAATTTASAAPSPARTEPAATAPKTTRQAVAQQRAAAAREQAAKAAQDNPEAVAAEMDAAGSFEKQAEIQNAVLGAMGFVAGFDAYGRVVIPDAVGYRPFEIYPGQRNIDTPAARGLVGRSDRIHEEMVNEQYR